MWLKSISQWYEAGISCALVTIIDSEGSTPRKVGSKMAVNMGGTIAGSVGGGAVELACIDLAKRAIADGTCITRSFISKGEGEEWIPSEGNFALGVCGGSLTVFIEPIIVEPELVIFGGGHIGFYLGKMCEILEVPYRVYDAREDFVCPERFPGARGLVCAPFNTLKQEIVLGGRSYCVIMTYGHEHDEEVLRQLLSVREIPYIGMIGSVRKASVLIQNIKKKGVSIDDRLYCPIGVKIGRNLPQEIALSVMSEVILLMRGGSLEHMRKDWTDTFDGERS
jgi:xanthine dehydrogenase accessory factor